MKEIEFYSNTPEGIKTKAMELLLDIDKKDPASIHYERVLERPRISWLRVLAEIVVPSAAFLIMVNALPKKEKHFFPMLLICGSFGGYMLSNSKRFLIGAVRIYQRYAPESIRMKCRFEPSCSQYMILSLEKYGLVTGLKMGMQRLSRCKVGNGGYDFP